MKTKQKTYFAVEASLNVESSLRESGELLKWMDEAFADCGIKSPDGSPWAANVLPSIALFHQVVEHAFAIVRLCSAPPHYGSAFALVRPMFEGLVRGLWLADCASTEEADKFVNHDKLDFELRELIAKIEASHAGFAGGFLTQVKSTGWTAMCSFAHSGARQIARRVNGMEVTANYDDGAILEVLKSARLFPLLGLYEVAVIARRDDLQQSLLSRIRTELAP